jgi:hypothetical protein
VQVPAARTGVVEGLRQHGARVPGRRDRRTLTRRLG